MKKKIGALGLLFLCLAGGLYFLHGRSAAPTAKQAVPPPDPVEQIVSAMPPETRVGQLLMIGLLHPDLQDADQKQLDALHAGNVILFDRNMENPEQVQALNAELTRQIKEKTGVKPFLALDQEGGAVLRMRAHFPKVPSENAIGETGNPENAAKWAEKTGTELKKMGFTLNFAPVADLGLANNRSYGKNPENVAAFVEKAVTGYDRAGIFCALKHFPGIGKTRTDPHTDGEKVAISLQEMEQQDLKPFAALIKAHPSRMMVMVSNVTFPALDENFPACVSKNVMTDLLRQKLGFQGLIVSDDMEMGAMAKHYAFKDMGVMAIKAGADMVLVCHDYRHEKETCDGLLAAYKTDPAFRALVDDRVKRIVRAKLQL